MRRFSFLTFICALLLSARPATVRAGGPHQIATQSFDLERDSGVPLVEVHFSNGKIGLFEIDTGAYECVMTPACAKRLGCKPDDNPADGLVHLHPIVHIKDMQVGSLRVADIAFDVAVSDAIGTNDGRPVDGLLGGNLLSHFALLLDYPRRTLAWIYPGDLSDKAVAELGLDPAGVINLHQESYFELDLKVNHYSTRAQLQSGTQQCREEMWFDTGAPSSSISSEAAGRLALVPSGLQPYHFVFQAPDTANKAVVPLLHLGPLTFSDVFIIYPSHAGSYMVSLIGANVLGGCVALFDFGPHRCFLKPVLPGMTSDPLPPLDTSKIDWERLRNAPESLGFSELLRGVLHPETLESLPLELTRLQATPSGGTEDAEKCERMGTLLRQSEVELGAKAAFDAAVRLRRAEADAHPEDPVRAAQWTEALISSVQPEAALQAAEKNAAKWPASPDILYSLGAAQEARAVFLLLDGPGKTVTDDEALDPFLRLGAKPGKPAPERVQQIATLRRQARDNYDQAVTLAPLDPDEYSRRARFWLQDRLLLALMGELGVKGQSPSTESALAAELADYRTEARLRPDDAAVLRRVVLLDDALPQFHDDGWFRKNLRGTGQENELQNETQSSSPVTAKSALARLAVLSESSDPKTAAPALEALGEAQADTDDPAAEATLRKSLAQDPARSGALASLAALLIADNRLSALGDLLLKQSGSEATSASCLLLSGALSAVGQTATAEEEAREALKRLPDSPQANLELARLLLARSGDDPSVLPEAGACLTQAETGLGPFASPVQKASLQTLQAVYLALSGDPATARTQLLKVLRDRPSCTQAREALYALTIPPSS